MVSNRGEGCGFSFLVLQFPPGTVVNDQVKGRVDRIPSPDDQPSRPSLDALIGKPAPEFPEGAAWLNSNPLTLGVAPRQGRHPRLLGRVVRALSQRLAPAKPPPRGPRLNGRTVVGIHPPGSTPEAIGKIMDEFHLGYPVCATSPAGRRRGQGPALPTVRR